MQKFLTVNNSTVPTFNKVTLIEKKQKSNLVTASRWQKVVTSLQSDHSDLLIKQDGKTDSDHQFKTYRGHRRFTIRPNADSPLLQKRRCSFLDIVRLAIKANAIHINNLPEKLLFKIFQCLTIRDLCVAARVCKAWQKIAYEPYLWRSLNFRPEYGGIHIGSPEVMMELVAHRVGHELSYLELNCDLITVDVLENLYNNFPNLRYLTLDFSNAMQLYDFNDLNGFPASLFYLCICLSDVIFMEGLMRKIYSCLSSIQVLHLIGTFEHSNEEEEEIYEVINISKIKAHTPNLRIINLFGINFVDDSHVELLANNCIHLECIALNYCLKVKGSSLKLVMKKCNQIKCLLMQHCDLKDEHMQSVAWESTQLEELDITSSELSTQCLENILLRIPPLRYLAMGHSDFVTDKILVAMSAAGRFKNLRAIDLSYCPMLTDGAVETFCLEYGPQLHGIMLKGNPTMAEYFWITVLPKMRSIRTCVLGSADDWFFKFNTRVHIDQVIECIAQQCSKIEALEIQWDPDTIRFSDKSRKFIDHIRLKCPRLKSFTLSDGKYYEMVKSNFERADRFQVVRTITTYETTLVNLLRFYRDLQFN